MDNIVTHDIETLPFVPHEVLENDHDITRRKDHLYLAMVLGNNYGKIARLTVHTDFGTQQLEGVVMALTTHTVILRGHMLVPMCAVETVTLL